MRSQCAVWLTACLVWVAVTMSLQVAVGAELVEAKKVWNQPHRIASTDLVRFKNRWFCVFDAAKPSSWNHDLHVIASTDGTKWESVAHIKPRTPIRDLHGPRFAVADNRLLLTAVGASKQTTRQSMLWDSSDGRNWSEPKRIGEANYVLSDIAWHQGAAYSYGYGCICGIAQTVQIRRSSDGRYFADHFEHNFSGFFPKAAAMAFDGDRAVCLLSRSNGPSSDRSTLIGLSQSPFTSWDWKWSDVQMSHPSLIRMPDGQIVAGIGLHEPRVRTSLCVLDETTGKLDEALKLPVHSRAIKVGLAAHEGHLWATYHTPDGRGDNVHLAKIRLAK